MATKKISYNSMLKEAQSAGSLDSAFSAAKSVVPTTKHWEQVKLEDIIEDPKGDFTTLFPYNIEIAKTIAESMHRSGYDQTQVIHLARIREEPETMEKGIRIDGRHRFEAAKMENLESIPAYIHTFDTRREALIYALELQVLRRNLEAHQKFEALQRLDELRNPGRKKDGEALGKSSIEVAAQIGESPRTVERMRNIINNGTEEVIAAVKAGEVSISQGDKITNEQKKQKKAAEKKDALEDTSGAPAGLPSFDHSDHVERPVPETGDDTVFVTLEEKNIQCESARKDGFSKGFELALMFALAEVKKGRTPEEIWRDERLTDLSPSVIYNFNLPEEDEEIINGF